MGFQVPFGWLLAQIITKFRVKKIQ